MASSEHAWITSDLSPLRATVSRRLSGQDDATDLMRLFHGRGRTFPGLEEVVLDYFAGTLRLGLYSACSAGATSALAAAVSSACAGSRVDGAWLQWRDGSGAPVEVLFGAPRKEVEGREDGLRCVLRPGAAQNAGLFLDARPARNWLRRLAADKRVLNLFSYTCGFSLAACAGGAREVVNLDMVRSVLDIGQRNHSLNGFTQARFLPHDLWRSWGALKRRGPFDLVVLDPPSFQRGSFEADRDWPRLLKRLDDLVAAGGQALVLVNSPFVPRQQLADWRRAYAPSFTISETLPASPDFPDVDPDRGLKVQVWQRSLA